MIRVSAKVGHEIGLLNDSNRVWGYVLVELQEGALKNTFAKYVRPKS